MIKVFIVEITASIVILLAVVFIVIFLNKIHIEENSIYFLKPNIRRIEKICTNHDLTYKIIPGRIFCFPKIIFYKNEELVYMFKFKREPGDNLYVFTRLSYNRLESWFETQYIN